MTDLAQIALAFCRECLGWEDAGIQYSSNGVIWNGKLKENSKGFHFTDLNAVMAAVRGWCSEHDMFISTCTMPTLKAVSAQVFRHDIRVEIEHLDFGHALLSACVEAARKMKESA